jgi:Short-chain alcohol dehydrogenase of unknown specificity
VVVSVFREGPGKETVEFINRSGGEAKTATIDEYSEEDWDTIICSNLKGAWLCMKYEIPVMLMQGGGAIVNTSSIAGLIWNEKSLTRSKPANRVCQG